MRKADIITTVSSQTGVERTDVQEVLEATLATIKKTLIDGDSLFIRCFGTFSNKNSSKKIARNISTNTAIILDAHYIPSFKPSKIFIKSVKENNRLAE